jgi:hypothetical protein
MAGALVYGLSTLLPCFTVTKAALHGPATGTVWQWHFNFWHVRGGWLILPVLAAVIAGLGVLGSLTRDQSRINGNGMVTGIAGLIPLVIAVISIHPYSANVETTLPLFAIPPPSPVVRIDPAIGLWVALIACAFLMLWPTLWSWTGGRNRSAAVTVGTTAPVRPPANPYSPTWGAAAPPSRGVEAEARGAWVALPPMAEGGGAAAGPAPGWYEDAANPGFARWWDGSAWTDHVQALSP